MTELKIGDRVSVKIKSDSLNVFHGSEKQTIDYSSVKPDGTNDTSIDGEIGYISSDKNEIFSPNDDKKGDIFINAIKLINVPFSALTPITNGGAKRKSRRPKKKSKKSKKNKSKRKSRRASK